MRFALEIDDKNETERLRKPLMTNLFHSYGICIMRLVRLVLNNKVNMLSPDEFMRCMEAP